MRQRSAAKIGPAQRAGDGEAPSLGGPNTRPDRQLVTGRREVIPLGR